MSIRKIVLVSAIAAVLAIAAKIGIDVIRRTALRDEWRREAIAEVANLTGDPGRLEAAKRALARGEGALEPPWLSRDLIVMADGSWVAYRQICKKSDWRQCDFFIGRAADGRWFYSRSHFCIDMAAFRGTEIDPPPDLADFVANWSLVDFNGNPDDIPTDAAK